MESVSQFLNENIHYQNEGECYKTNTIWKKKIGTLISTN